MNPIGSTRPRTMLRFLLAALVACALWAAPAGAAVTPPVSASQLDISGAGFGHGIGMSQYGAAGLAQHGWSYKQILSHYYTQTTLGTVNPNRTVTVLLHQGAASFSGATKLKGYTTILNPKTKYGVLSTGGKIELISDGRTIGLFNSPLTASGSGPLKLIGVGSYRGSFIFRPAAGGGVMTINAVGLDNYVRGVVAAEMPASWPAQALNAQAVAARTYAVTAGAVAADFDVYDDTRSQMYEGVTAETAASNAAVQATRGQVVEYDGVPAVTYFFASSGGYTESIQNVWSGVEPEAWLQGVPDPYDDSYNNPYYRWSDPVSMATATKALKSFYKGTFEGVQVTATGVSPRVVQAQVIGTGGDTTVTGAQLQESLSTLSTYMQLATISENGEQSAVPVSASTAPVSTTTSTMTTTMPTTTSATTTGPATTTTPASTGGSGLLSNAPVASTASAPSYLSIQGTIYPAVEGATVTAESNTSGTWTAIASAQVTATGSYVIPVPSAGVYQVQYDGVNGPSITVP
jgi:stage II sporulation protein D